MSSSDIDDSRDGCYGKGGSPTGGWTTAFLIISVVVNMMFTGFVWLELTYVQNTVETGKLQAHIDAMEIQLRQLSGGGVMKQLNDVLSDNGGGRVKRSAPSPPGQSSGVAVNVGHVFVSLIKQMCKPEGSICIPGEPGRAGTNGVPGKNGEPGSKGSAGKQGPRGIVGMKGETGERGEKGDKGERGERGMDGQQGIAGTQGTKGETGEKGDRGWTGYKGEKGGKGEIGFQGEKGMKGERGMKGSKADKQDFSELAGLPKECLPSNHNVLTETWRKTSEHYSKTKQHCDGSGWTRSFRPGWNSFSPEIGGAMPETCTAGYYCGTRGSGWLKGSHPTLIGEKVSRTVCFSSWGNCCREQTNIEVINCGKYYVYNLPYTGICMLAYCARG